jgi:23S rRNA pseudouridine1911/1915/1917 synthase
VASSTGAPGAPGAPEDDDGDDGDVEEPASVAGAPGEDRVTDLSSSGVEEHTEIIPTALAGERVDRVVALVTGLSRADAAALVDAGAVRVGGAECRTRSRRVELDDELSVRWARPEGRSAPEPDPAVVLVVVHEDDDVVVIDKPAGLVVHPGAGNEQGTLVNGLLARYGDLEGVGDPARPGIVHRLDKDTSGLLVVARTPEAHRSLVAQLAARSVHRRYETLVWGHLDARVGKVDAPIGRSAREPTRMAVTERGREAVTHYEVSEAFTEPVAVSRLRCRLETGRTHQIRVHLQAIGHPVVGDDRYHGVRQSFPVPRVFLHAAELGFVHPATGEDLSFTSPLPTDLAQVLTRLS